MKTIRFQVAAIAFLAVVVLVLTVWLFRPQPNELIGTFTNVAKIHPETNRGSTYRIATNRQQRKFSPTNTNQISPEVLKAAQLQEATVLKNSEINFWGKILDQNGLPLSGVRVVMRIRQWFYEPNAGPGTLSPKHEIISDADGRFAWTGAFGDSLELESVIKEGYRLSPKNRLGYDYTPNMESVQITAANPVIIRMWKLIERENLLTFRTLFGFAPDGRSYTMDLKSNKKHLGDAPDGDLVIHFTRPAKIDPKQKYDWGLDLEIIDGGLIEVNDEFGYMAPEIGYQKKINIQLRASAVDWTDTMTKDFYIRSRGGAIYGLLHLTISSEYDGQSAILFETRLNPSGSRNLQP